MDLHQLRGAVAVADHGSFTRAAAVLHVSQPSLSYAISRLETELRASLFVRLPRQVVPTAAGQTFLVHARAALEQADCARAAVSAAEHPVSGRVDLVHIRTATAVATRMIRDFRDRHPGAVCVVHEPAGDTEIVSGLRSGRHDVGIMRSDHVPRDLLAVDAGTERWGAVFAEDQAPARATIGLETLAEHPLVVPGAYSSMRAGFDEVFSQARLTPDVAAECTDIHMLLSLVAAGVGATLLPDSLARTRPDITYRTITPRIAHGLSVVRKAGSTTPTIDAFCAIPAVPTRSRKRNAETAVIKNIPRQGD
ncbi:LysR family transcriptional regulator [Nocardia jinanensis]|uniref:LysR family transcriptional regulator n=1 Tax=Nocardia jinanensis TaxID=382504 RepID=A0A917RY17_9NOCA|nr:LysR substrate-binding domain-containing protein [Nocardia jinanensis]GGL41947.1 LysR family transcriptional regulator [Nocardia jinanensis]